MRGFLVACILKLDSRLMVAVQRPSGLNKKRNLVMDTDDLLHLDLHLQAVNFWSKYYNHTLTCCLQQLISNSKICIQRKMPKRKPPLQGDCRSQREGKAECFRKDHLLLDYLHIMDYPSLPNIL